MRGVLTAITFLAFLVHPASAQGIKDPSNTTSSSIITTSSKKAQTTQASRPTAVRHVTGNLPAGKSAQGVWRDGKLIAVPR
ncbi:hypothetical protein [Bradyrhizobium sp. 199]|uniref:hypothetical protein n=1 Tax=Bradyrhizobium sp. 199 TaxID=2782664 RepID=UPI001FFB63BC|nr:hypothetical protein [Bradyrhizobium sp. 199]MCK1362243.1 hypothetical protein [Bradyrhizobium sp. 199]